MCTTDSVCGTGVCDNSIFVRDEKAWSCVENNEMTGGSVGVLWSIDSKTGKLFGVVDFYVRPAGAPFLFNCTFENCTTVAKGKRFYNFIV